MTFQQSEQINELASALIKVQANLKPAIKDAYNPFFKSKYADLGAIWDTCRDLLTSNGLSVAQFPAETERGRAALTTILMHSSGQFISSTASCTLKDDTAQGTGSALTYLRRYALAACIGIVADEDDDGNVASSAGKQQQPQSARPQASTKSANNGASYTPPPDEPSPTKKPPSKEGLIKRIRVLWLEERHWGGETPPSELTLDLEEMDNDHLIALGKRIAGRVDQLRKQSLPKAA